MKEHKKSKKSSSVAVEQAPSLPTDQGESEPDIPQLDAESPSSPSASPQMKKKSTKKPKKHKKVKNTATIAEDVATETHQSQPAPDANPVDAKATSGMQNIHDDSESQIAARTSSSVTAIDSTAAVASASEEAPPQESPRPTSSKKNFRQSRAQVLAVQQQEGADELESLAASEDDAATTPGAVRVSSTLPTNEEAPPATEEAEDATEMVRAIVIDEDEYEEEVNRRLAKRPLVVATKSEGASDETPKSTSTGSEKSSELRVRQLVFALIVIVGIFVAIYIPVTNNKSTADASSQPLEDSGGEFVATEPPAIESLSCQELCQNVTGVSVFVDGNSTGLDFKRAVLEYLKNPSTSPYGEIINCWDVSEVTNMSFAFSRLVTGVGVDDKYLEDPLFEEFNEPLNCWNTSSVTTVHSMFDGASDFNQDISSWDVSSVTSMKSMFWEALDFNQDISGWDVSRVKDMRQMFDGADAFNQDISGWDISSVTDMSFMFEGASSFNQDLCAWGDQVDYDADGYLQVNTQDMFFRSGCEAIWEPQVYDSAWCYVCYDVDDVDGDETGAPVAGPTGAAASSLPVLQTLCWLQFGTAIVALLIAKIL